MDDRELTEKAAAAAGIQGEWCSVGRYILRTDTPRDSDGGCDVWDPLDNDGDALRLAVKLRMRILRDGLEVTAEAPLDFGGSVKCSFVEHDELDAEAATRRAIVTTAAEAWTLRTRS